MRQLAEHLLLILALSAVMAALMGAESPCTPHDGPAEARLGAIEGEVRDPSAPVPGATVRIQATARSTMTDAQGRFTLVAPGEGPLTLTAWASGYYGGGPVPATSGVKGVVLRLRPHTDRDHPEYPWLSALVASTDHEFPPCAACHSREGTDFPHLLPADQWRADAHSQSAVNPRFLTMYRGTDVRGNRSPATRQMQIRDYGVVPLRPDASRPYFGPGYKLDFPHTHGNCAACHAPAAAVNDPYETDPGAASGVGAEGVACDLCHKVWDVRLDERTGLPQENMPGVLSFEFRRPPAGQQFFAGPYDDVATGEDTYSPLQARSQFCAPCHYGVFWDTVVYNSFGEWLASPYSDPQDGQTCQDCHMPPPGADRVALPEKKGLVRDPATIHGHCMPGASDEKLLQNAVTLTATARWEDQRISVDAVIRNEFTGHHVPTDSPLRHLILLVSAVDGQGRPLRPLEGPALPAWCGQGDPAEGCYAGLPGKAYAKILEEQWTGISPTGAYWNPTRVVSDNRIAALESDASRYRFAAPAGGRVIVDVKLFFRRAFRDLMDQKGWTDPDVLMESERLTLSAPQPR